MGSFEEEIRAKRAIKLAEKDHEENLARAKEISQLAKALQEALKNKTAIDRDSSKKLERLEKLTKKIRNEAGGEDEEVKIVDRPANIIAAVNQIAESAEQLSKTVQDTPRQVVSASVIGNANVLLELIKLLRAFDPRQ
jgi:seryl-tRNA synthetase